MVVEGDDGGVFFCVDGSDGAVCAGKTFVVQQHVYRFPGCKCFLKHFEETCFLVYGEAAVHGCKGSKKLGASLCGDIVALREKLKT